jgi:predicted RNA binding protein YcfA (HicA-like mRNA interferase family)
MSSRTPRLTAKQVIKQLKKAGFTEISQTGSHLKLFNQETRRTAIVPIHSSIELKARSPISKIG